MEAIERYSSLSNTYPRTLFKEAYSQVLKTYDKVLHPDELVEPDSGEYNETYTILDFLPGFDLISDEVILVPAEIASYGYYPKHPASCIFIFSYERSCFRNTLEEAICHALCEVIERDAVSIADLCASSIPYNILERIIDSLRKTKIQIYYSKYLLKISL